MLKRMLIGLLLVVSAYVVSACDGKPDLIVTNFTVEADNITEASDNIRVPVSVSVQNQGTVAADVFKVSVDFTDENGQTFVVAFTSEDSSRDSIWYPYHERLAADDTVTFEGNLLFNNSRLGDTVTLVALADSCSGEEFAEDYCFVDESNEDNNTAPSSPTSITLEEN